MQTKAKPRSSTLIILSAITFLGFIDTVLLLPVISLYAEELGAAMGMTGFIVGLYSIANTPANIIFGRLIDKVGNKIPLVGGLLGDSISLFLYSLCRLPFHLAIVRFVHGIAGGMVGPATMFGLSQCSGQDRRGRIMGIYGISIASATLIGYPLSGIIASYWGYNALFYITSGLLFAASIIALKLPHGKPETCPGTMSVLTNIKQMASLLKIPGLRVAYISIMALYFSFGGLITLLPYHIGGIGLEALHVGILLGIFSAFFIIMQIPVGYVSDKIGRLKPAGFGLVVCFTSLAILPGMHSLLSLGIIMALFGISFGIIFPSVSSMVIDHSTTRDRGVATGMFHALLTLGVAAGAPLIGGIGQWLGISAGLYASAAMVVLALAVTLKETLRTGISRN
ncbi:MAG: MFS transporter [Dehalococcoidaceae bacterium]|nr:MFS transporter [Dehalococcoidaceae bacterium]